MDFSLVLFLFVIITGVISLGYRLLYERTKGALRMPGARTADVAAAPRRLPMLVEYARAFFPVILAVFLLRSFVIEPFRIPSGSMLPSLRIGDFILVNKYTYGVRLPLVHRKIIPLGKPARGDVMVFRYPHDPRINFVKRVVGLPGDTLRYRDKQLYINDKLILQTADGVYYFRQTALRGQSADRRLEAFDESTHSIILDRNANSRNMEVRVPPGNYFVMGDNRDHSNDSRFWRFVPEDHIVGKAFFIWFSWKSLEGGGVRWSRIGDSIE